VARKNTKNKWGNTVINIRQMHKIKNSKTIGNGWVISGDFRDWGACRGRRGRLVRYDRFPQGNGGGLVVRCGLQGKFGQGPGGTKRRRSPPSAFGTDGLPR